jgi:winged helix DNA-binding protein
MKLYTWEMACRRRLARQYLLAPAQPAQLVDVVRTAGGIQAQILSAAELAIGARISGSTRQGVQAALWEQRALVKTYGPRGTLHLLPADELPLWMAALSEAETLGGTPWYRRSGLEPSEAGALLDAIGEALDGRCLTRKELAAHVTRRVGKWARERLLSAWGEFLAPAALAGKLCFGPGQGSQVAFARADQWIGHWEQHEPRTALIELTRRYIAAYGPATHGDVAHWFRLKPAQAQTLLEPLATDLEAVDFAGRRAWMLAADVQREAEANTGEWADGAIGSLRLLPQYDCYLLGGGPRERIVPEMARPRVNSYGRGRFEGATALSVMLIDGVVSGIWEQRARGRKPNQTGELRVESFGDLTARQRQQLDAEVARIGAFLGTTLALSFGVLGE